MKHRFLHLLVILCCCGLGAAADDPAAPQVRKESDRLMTYYRTPVPENISGILKALDAAPLERGALSPLFGFFYEVCRANPDRVPGWLWSISKFRQPLLKKVLGTAAAIAVPESRKLVADLPPQLPSPEQLDRMTADDPDLCWGRFFATGDAKHVNTVLRRALNAKDKEDEIDLIAYAARWSLFALSRQMPEVEKIFRGSLPQLSDGELEFLFTAVELPERERLLGKERAAKLPPPVKRTTQAKDQNPFKGLFKEWKGRPNPNEEARICNDRYIADLVRMYPGSDPEDIRKFIVWFCIGGVKDHAAGMKDAPCADPWAEAVRVTQLCATSRNDAAAKANEALIARLPSGDLLRMELLFLGRNSAKPDSEEWKRLDREFIAEIESVVLEGKFPNAFFYQRLYNLLSGSSSCGGRYWIELEERLKPHADRIDPWFWEMVQGRAGIAAAWEGRGYGLGRTVTREGWTVFGDNLDKARRHFNRAIELFPERYNAHIRLITVEMGSGSVAALIEVFKKIAWYNAVNESAWKAVLWGLQPRWCGSFELMKMLAVEALECPRRDVGVAEMGYQTLGYIAKYSDMRWQNLFLDPATRQLGDRLFSEYEKRMTTPNKRHIFLRHKFCRELALLEYDAAAKTFGEFGGAKHFAEEQWWNWGGSFSSGIGTPMYDDPAMRIKVFTGSRAAELREAEKLFLSGRDDRAALEKLASVIRGGDLPPDEKEFLIDLYGRWRLDCSPEDFCLRKGKYMSAYLVAQRENRSDVAEEMVKLGFRPKEKNPGDIVFGIVAAGDNTGEILRRHAAGEDIDVVNKAHGNSPLHLAARYGNTEMVETLLKCGAKIDRRDNTGHTPLHLAAFRKRGPAVRVLFKYGADPNEQDNEGDFSLLYLPQVHALSDMYKIFLDHPKINVNLRNHAGETALHYMAKSGTPAKIFQMMIAAGADCNIRDNGGRTPLDAAVSSGKTETAEFLRSVGGKRGSELPPPKSAAPAPSGEWWSNIPFEYWYAAGVGLIVVLTVVVAVLKMRKKTTEKP